MRCLRLFIASKCVKSQNQHLSYSKKKHDLGLTRNTKCLVNADAFIGKTIGSDIELDWIFIGSWAGENF